MGFVNVKTVLAVFCIILAFSLFMVVNLTPSTIEDIEPVESAEQWRWSSLSDESKLNLAAIYTMTTGVLERGNFIHPRYGLEVPIIFELKRQELEAGLNG